MTTVENSVPTKKHRRTRRQSLPALVAKLGRTPSAIEQSPDGTVRLIFSDATQADPLDQELASWKARRGQAQP